MVIEDAHESYMLSGVPISHQDLSGPRRGRRSARRTWAPYNDLSTMKFTLAIPSVRVPQVPTISYATEIPRVRIPFLSLLLEPRPLKKWLLIWAALSLSGFLLGVLFRVGAAPVKP